MKRTIPLLIAAVGGLAMIVAYFIPATQSWGEVFLMWFNILAAIAFILGGGSLLKMHLQKISNRRAGWGYSVVTLVAFFAMLLVGLFKIGVHPSATYPGHPWAAPYNQTGSPFDWLYEFAFKPLTATMFALLAFYIASAAFRAFRAKNVEAILLLSTAFIILLGRTFAGYLMTDWLAFEEGSRWEFLEGLRIENLTVTIMKVFNTAGNRAIMIGIALGIASTSLKVILGIDRSYLGTGEE